MNTAAALVALTSPKFKWRAWAPGVFVLFVVMMYFWSERDLPTVIGPQSSYPEVHAGEELLIDVPAQRRLDHNCTMTLTRDIVNSQGERRNLVSTQTVAIETVRAREQASPGRLKLRILIPASTLSGVTQIISDIAWTCPYNPTTWVLPIRNTFVWYFYVKPRSGSPEAKPMILANWEE